MYIDWKFIICVLFRLALAVITGILIGIERARHGGAAGMRTHILVCLGAALTSMISIYVSKTGDSNTDIMRISAQVISGIGFLGAGMIILKNNNVITGLTTAAGVWTTSIIGIAIGFGFYSGALIATVMFLASVIFLAKIEKNKKAPEVIYMEIDDMYSVNTVIKKAKEYLKTDIIYKTLPPKSGYQGHIGVNLIIEKNISDISDLCSLENVVFIEEE